MIDIKAIARLYGASDFSVIKEINSCNMPNDKRFVFLIEFDGGRKIAIKACKNSFTNREKVAGWKRLCESYLDLGIYCPRILDSVNGESSEIIIFDNEEYVVYAEEIKKYRTCDELDDEDKSRLNIKSAVLESIGKVAANCAYLLPFPSVFCVYDTFCPEDEADENYQNADNFCKSVKENFKEYSSYADEMVERKSGQSVSDAGA